jgi:hypothetical protein
MKNLVTPPKNVGKRDPYWSRMTQNFRKLFDHQLECYELCTFCKDNE